ncbi:MAG: response regulator [Fibrobacterales bacterium]
MTVTGRKGTLEISSSNLHNRNNIFILLFFIMSSFIAAFIGLGYIEKDVRENTAESLKGVLWATNQNINKTWADIRFANAEAWAKDLEITSNTKILLDSGNGGGLYAKQKALGNIRHYFEAKIDVYGAQGIFIVSSGMINIASMRDNNMGMINVISRIYSDRLNKVFLGENQLIPPMPSEVLLMNEKGEMEKDYPTMFLAVPIKDGSKVVAALCIRFNPFHEFSDITTNSRIGQTGETYIINKKGLLLTESRFDDELYRKGLLNKNQNSLLNIRISEPGINIQKNETGEIKIELHPLTRAALEITLEKSGWSIQSYRDYRGAYVFGAWMWDENLGVGFITEIDEVEALKAYTKARLVIILLVGAIILLSVLLYIWTQLYNIRFNKRILEQEHYLESILNIVDPIIVCNAEGYVQIANSASSLLYQYRQNELSGLDFNTLFDIPLYSREREMEISDTHPGGEEVKTRAFECVSRKKKGETFSVKLTMTHLTVINQKLDVYTIHDITHEKTVENILRTRQNAIEQSNRELDKSQKAAMSILQDTNIQKKKTQTALAELQKSTVEVHKLSLAIEQSHVSVIITNRRGEIEYANQSFLNITGYEMDEILGQNPRILQSGTHTNAFYKQLWDTIFSGEVWAGEFENKRKDGEFFWESATISPVKNESGKVTNFIAVKEDITERKIMEAELLDAKNRAEQATQAKSDFLANMSHEIRTPMNAIIGMSYLMQKTEQNEKQEDYTKKIQAASKNLLVILNDILDFSKIEAGKLTIEKVEFKLSEVMATLGDATSLKAQEKGVELIFDISKDIPDTLIGDPLRLGQVLLNLVNNAIKFTDQGEVYVQMERVKSNRSQVEIEFHVQDTGIGLKEVQLEKLFSAFTQADTSTTRHYGGTGLGLTISKQLCELMDGTIGVESVFGKGSTFYFTLPFECIDDGTDKRDVLPSVLNDLRVLIVDDNATAREVIRGYLSSFTKNIVEADSGNQALKEIERQISNSDQPFDLVIMDWIMPDGNGVDTIKSIQKNTRIINGPKFLMATGYGADEFIDTIADLNIDGFILKPVFLSLLVDSICSIFGARRKPIQKKNSEGYSEQDFRGIQNCKILLVEDNEMNQQIACELLQGEGAHVEVAGNGRVAHEMVLLAEGAYDVVLMDLQMPEMGGVEATRIIRRKYTKEELPIIAMTADAMSGVEASVISNGMNGYISKPINPSEVFKVISRHVSSDLTGETDLVPLEIEQEIPDIPGINMHDALRRVRGNVKLYKKLLLAFVEKYKTSHNEIADCINRRDFKHALFISHSLMGVSGNIGADALHEMGEKIYDLVESDPESDFEPLLNMFKNKLEETMNGIANAIPEVNTEMIAEKVSMSTVELASMLNSLYHSLDIDMGKVVTLNKELVKKLKPTEYQYQKIAHYVELFDTDSVAKEIVLFAKKYNLTLENP